jgi:hypothetical protein
VERVVKLNFEDNRLQVRAVQEISYPIILSENIFDPQNEILLTGGRVREGRRFVVIDDFIYKLHCEAIETYFEYRRITAKIVALPGGAETPPGGISAGPAANRCRDLHLPQQFDL